jgi:hypothetical protein
MLMRPTNRSRRMSGKLLILTSKIAAMTTSVMSDAAMIGVTIIVTAAVTTAAGIVIDKMTLGDGRTIAT